MEREVDNDDDDEDPEDVSQLGIVSAPLFPKEKKEGCWIVVGDTKTNKLLSLKRVNLQRKQKITLEFMAPDEPGDHGLSLFCMSDSYLGSDQEMPLQLSVAAAVSDNDDDESEAEEEEE